MHYWISINGLHLPTNPAKRVTLQQQPEVRAGSFNTPVLACFHVSPLAGQAHALQRRTDKFQKAFPRPASSPRKVVYSYKDAYMFSRIVMSDDLVFDSHFESGNLAQASRIKTASGNMEYELVLSPDPSKKAHVQWSVTVGMNCRLFCLLFA